MHSGGIYTANEAGTSPSRHDQGRPRQQERTAAQLSLLNRSIFMIAACRKCSIKCILLYQNASQAELQWKMEEYNRLWCDCKVNCDCLYASWHRVFCICVTYYQCWSSAINDAFFCRKRWNKRRDYCSNSNISLKKTRKHRYTGQVRLRDSLLKWTSKTFTVAGDSVEPRASYFSSLLDVCSKFEDPSDK